MKNNEWKEKIRNDYKNILSEKQIQATIDYWDSFISSLLAQTRQDTVREVIERIGKDKNRFQRFIKETNPSAINTLNGYETACNDLTEELREDYNIKDE